eukprot:SAG31_NODE_212_length_20157_cov_9.648868_4_plen_74_part_00
MMAFVSLSVLFLTFSTLHCMYGRCCQQLLVYFSALSICGAAPLELWLRTRWQGSRNTVSHHSRVFLIFFFSFS